MLQGKKAYICSPLSAPDPEGVQHNMELAKYYLMQMKKGLVFSLWMPLQDSAVLQQMILCVFPDASAMCCGKP